MTQMSLERLGGAVRASRKFAGLAREALADATGSDRSHMSKIELGERNVTPLNYADLPRLGSNVASIAKCRV